MLCLALLPLQWMSGWEVPEDLMASKEHGQLLSAHRKYPNCKPVLVRTNSTISPSAALQPSTQKDSISEPLELSWLHLAAILP